MIKETQDEYIVDLEVYIEEMNRYDYVVVLDKTLDGPTSPEEAYRMAAASVNAGDESVAGVEWGIIGEEGIYSSLGNNSQINYQLKNLEKELYGYRMALECLLDTESSKVKSAMRQKVNDLKEKIDQLEMAYNFNTGENT